jgi:hypothetical protein
MNRRYGFLALLVSMTGVFAPVRAAAQVIFVSPCGLEIPQNQIGLLKVWVCLEGAIRDGITGAEFRIDGLPAGWIVQAEPSPPSASVTGDLFGDGTSISFTCGHPEFAMYFELFSVGVFATDTQTDVLLAATAIRPLPAPPNDCAYVYLCDAPTFTKVCVQGSGAWINPRKFGCGLAVEATSWARVKSLYRGR